VRILITGVAGFIGSNLAEYLLKNGYSVIGIDNLSYGVIEQVPHEVEFFQVDILDGDLIKYLSNIDVVFHLAAKNCISDCQSDPVETAMINVVGSINVFEACRKAGIKRVIYAESSALYEGSDNYPTKEDDTKPLSFYAVSKYAEKYFSDAFARFYDMEMTALRYFNVYGPKQDYRRTIPPLMSAVIINLLKGNSPTIYGNGEKRRDFVYVDDINEFHEMIINDKRTFGKVYNLGSGLNYSVNEINEKIQKLLEINIAPIFKEDISGETFQNLADITAAKSIGWYPKITLEDGLNKTIDYIKKIGINLKDKK